MAMQQRLLRTLSICSTMYGLNSHNRLLVFLNLTDIYLCLQEVRAGRLPARLLPLQSGVGNIANAVIANMVKAPFQDVQVWSEVCSLIQSYQSIRILNTLTNTGAYRFCRIPCWTIWTQASLCLPPLWL